MEAPCTLRHVITVLVLAGVAIGPPAVSARRAVPDAVVEDFGDVVTRTDLGFDDFAGNAGTINKDEIAYGASALICERSGACGLELAWDFTVGPDREAFTGLFFSLFGLTDTQVTFDGGPPVKLEFPEHTLDLDRIDGVLQEPDGARSVHELCFNARYGGEAPLALRVELGDAQGGRRFRRFILERARRGRTLCWSFRDPASYREAGSGLEVHQVKTLSLVVERENLADAVVNPERGALRLKRVWLIPDRPERQPRSQEDLLDLLERRSCQYFLDWSSRKAESLGIPQDRSTFADLLTIGGVGFALTAYAICSQRGWIDRADAAGRALAVLRLLDGAPQGPEPIGRVGHRGWFYHFLGPDGRRKLNFDSPTSPRNEALNTVELSTIDTGLALMGVLAAQSYFDATTPEEAELRSRAQSVYDRVEWDFMLERCSEQFYLGWKPEEPREGAPFLIPDARRQGQYSGTIEDPHTLDVYTDELLIVALLALGSSTNPVPPTVYCAWPRTRDAGGLVRSFPGSLFTYQFLRAFVDTGTVPLPACPAEAPVDWLQNSRKAILATIAHARKSRRFRTYGRNAGGLSAGVGRDDQYRAYGAPPVALDPMPEEDGTVTYYGMLSALTFGDDLRGRALRALGAAWTLGHWHLRFGLPDAFHRQIAQADLAVQNGTGNELLRTVGPWVQRALFAIDQGPILLHAENARSGLVWSLLSRNGNFRAAVERLHRETAVPQPRLVAEAEGQGAPCDGDVPCCAGELVGGACGGEVKCRSSASREQTVLLHAGGARSVQLRLLVGGRYSLRLRYSNDNFGASESLDVLVDDAGLGQFDAEDTGDRGFGWNVFAEGPSLGPVSLEAGVHHVTVGASGGDGFGVELDRVELNLAG